ncbi:Uma2 family endonuclease [Streptomyces sp. NPDC051366]|uniref:Uma2 family endonuclease n=1 Tax=Streptomyces sp. NPDC051366 TaxID=3365652 RepID=UPI00378BBCEE
MCRTAVGALRYRDRREAQVPVPRVPERRAIPDAVLAPTEAFVGQGEWSEPDPVLMVVEVTSWDSDTHRRDHVEKPRAYAETGIPVYLLIDRAKCQISVYSQPNGRQYKSVHIVPYGTDIALPEPVGITLQTEVLKDRVR